MSFATHLSFWAPPNPTSEKIGREGEIFAAKVRLWTLVGSTWIPLWLVLRDPGFGSWLGVIYAIVTVLMGIVVLRAARRPQPPRWLGAFTCVFDVSMVSALPAALMAAGEPGLALNAEVGFNLYLIALAFTCVRQDMRLCVLAGVTAIVEYGAVIAWVVIGGGVPVQPLLPISRIAILAIATLANVAIVNQSRSYLLELAHLVKERTREAPAPLPLPAPAPPPSAALPDNVSPLDLGRLDSLRRLEEMVGKPMVRQILDTYLTESPRRLERLRTALGHADAKELAFVAHSLKGSSLQVGAARVAALSLELEKMGKGADLGAAVALLAELERELARVAPLLEEQKSIQQLPATREQPSPC